MKRSALIVIPVAALFGVVALAVFRGCDSLMPKGANARLISNVHQDRTKGRTDIVIVGRFKSQAELSKRTKGNWVTTRYLVVFDVVRVEQGEWPHSTLAFVAADSWPTPESGIMVRALPWPYRPGVIMRFKLESPDRIIGQQPVSTTQPAELLQL